MVFQQCGAVQAAWFECKRGLGLLPQQCYPAKGYGGDCGGAEFAYKRCLAFAADGQAAHVLYDKGATRQAKLDANARLQRKLRAFNVPCTD